MIEQLTEEQKAAIPRYVEKWIAIGTNTDRLNYDRTLDIVHSVQEHLLKAKKTPVVIFDNPLEAWVACNLSENGCAINDLKKKTNEFFDAKVKPIKLQDFVMPYLAGSFCASFFSFYDYFRTEVGIDYKEVSANYDIWQSTSELGMIFPLGEVCIVSEKPSKISLNEARVAHCDGGPAISYEGLGNINVYMLNGVRVPEWLAVTHSEKIDPKRYTEITNADQKAEFVKKVGEMRLLEMGKMVDTYKNYNDPLWTKSQYELWDLHDLFRGVDKAYYVKMLNQTTKVWHVEAVSPECHKLPLAIKERLRGMDLDIVAIS